MIVGISGKAGAGKTTAGKILEDKGFQHLAFADPLREFLIAQNPILGIDTNVYHRVAWCVTLAEEIEKYGWQGYKTDSKFSREIRELIQRTGTEAGRGINPNMWIDATVRRINSDNVVISDVRYPNEAQAVKDLGGQIWRIERTMLKVLNHSSETEMDNYEFDRVILNDGTINNLAWSIEKEFDRVW